VRVYVIVAEGVRVGEGLGLGVALGVISTGEPAMPGTSVGFGPGCTVGIEVNVGRGVGVGVRV
jgi:hypothetical protein